MFAGAGLRRSIGGSLAALGVVGLMLTATTSLFGGSGGLGHDLGTLTTAGRAAAPDAADNGAVAMSGSDALMTAAPAVPAASPAQLVAAGSPESGYAAAATASASTGKDVPAWAGPPSTSSAGIQHSVAGAGPGSASGQDSDQNGPGVVDARLFWLAGFGLLFVVGLAIILIPWLSRRRQVRS
jgi:hypothetical protein